MADKAAAVVALRRATFGVGGVDCRLPEVFTSLQYEHAWLVGWAAAISNAPPRSSPGLDRAVPYGHPTYPAVAEANGVLESLAELLREHAIPNLDPSGENDPPHVTLVGLPSTFRGGTAAEEGAEAPHSRAKTTFRTVSWTDGERSRFSTLVSHLRQVNDMLAGFAKDRAYSIDIAGSATLLGTTSQHRAGNSPPLAPATTDSHDRHSELACRLSLQQQNFGRMQLPPSILSLEAIDLWRTFDSDFGDILETVSRHTARVGDKITLAYRQKVHASLTQGVGELVSPRYPGCEHKVRLPGASDCATAACHPLPNAR